MSYSGGLRGVRWRGDGGLGWRRERGGRCGLGGGREAVVVVAFNGIANGFAPVIGVEGLTIFVLGNVDGLHEGLHQVGDGVGGSGFDIAAEDGGDEAPEGGTEIAGGEVVAGEEVVEVFAEFISGAGAGFFLGVVETEMRVIADARGAATTAVRERKRTQGHAVLWTERGHRSLLRVEFWDCLQVENRKSKIENRKTKTRAGKDAGGTNLDLKQKRPDRVGAQF